MRTLVSKLGMTNLTWHVRKELFVSNPDFLVLDHEEVRPGLYKVRHLPVTEHAWVEIRLQLRKVTAERTQVRPPCLVTRLRECLKDEFPWELTLRRGRREFLGFRAIGDT